jgi:hypothetical protein
MFHKKKNDNSHAKVASSETDLDGGGKKRSENVPQKKRPKSVPKAVEAKKKPFDFRKLSLLAKKKRKKDSLRKASKDSTKVKKRISSDSETSITFVSEAVNKTAREQSKDLNEATKSTALTEELSRLPMRMELRRRATRSLRVTTGQSRLAEKMSPRRPAMRTLAPTLLKLLGPAKSTRLRMQALTFLAPITRRRRPATKTAQQTPTLDHSCGELVNIPL